MCNDFGNRVPYGEYLRAFSEIRVPLRWPTTPPNLEPRDDIWPTEPSDVVKMGWSWCSCAGVFRLLGPKVRR